MLDCDRKVALPVAVVLVALLVSACSSDSAGLEERLAQLEQRIEQQEGSESRVEKCLAEALVELGNVRPLLSLYSIIAEGAQFPNTSPRGSANEISVVKQDIFVLVD